MADRPSPGERRPLPPDPRKPELWAELKRSEVAAPLQPVPREALLWMALAPGWTPARARQARFPAGSDGIPGVFSRLVDAGLADVLQSPLEEVQESGREVYSLAAATCAEILAGLRKASRERDAFAALRDISTWLLKGPDDGLAPDG